MKTQLVLGSIIMLVVGTITMTILATQSSYAAVGKLPASSVTSEENVYIV